MPYLICYDIENDKWRKKVSDKLIAFGLERVQYSVFIGPASTAVFAALLAWLQQSLPQLKGPKDSILILDLSSKQIEKMRILGNSSLDIGILAGSKNTLFL